MRIIIIIYYRLVYGSSFIYFTVNHSTVLQELPVDSPAHLEIRALASSPADARTAATQPPATVSTADDVKTDTRVATAGADRAVRQVSCQTSCLFSKTNTLVDIAAAVNQPDMCNIHHPHSAFIGSCFDIRLLDCRPVHYRSAPVTVVIHVMRSEPVTPTSSRHDVVKNFLSLYKGVRTLFERVLTELSEQNIGV